MLGRGKASLGIAATSLVIPTDDRLSDAGGLASTNTRNAHGDFTLPSGDVHHDFSEWYMLRFPDRLVHLVNVTFGLWLV